MENNIENKEKMNLGRRIIIVIVGDILAILFLVFAINRLQLVAKEIQTLRTNAQNFTPVNVDVVKTEISKLEESKKKLQNLFPNEDGLVDFVNKIDEFKQSGIVTNFSFASSNIVKDKTGYSGFPITIDFKGTWSEIDTTLKLLSEMPYIFRAVDIKATELQNEAKQVIVSYGGFLYVNENFGKN